jgi:hypothetical protein
MWTVSPYMIIHLTGITSYSNPRIIFIKTDIVFNLTVFFLNYLYIYRLKLVLLESLLVSGENQISSKRINL